MDTNFTLMKTLLLGTFLVILAPACVGQCTSIPLSYCARTDHNVAGGAAPRLGAAGTSTTDPDFGGKVLRVTSSGYAGTSAGHDFILPVGYNPTFSPDDLYLLIQDFSGGKYVQGINTATSPISLSGSPINVNGSPNPGWYSAIGFSAVSDILYGWSPSYKTLQSWDLNTSHAATTIYDFSAMPGFTIATPYAPLGPWWDHSDGWFCAASDRQDVGTELGCYNKSTTKTQVLNLASATEQQNSGAAIALDNLTASQLAGCGIHNTLISFDGTWATITVNGCTAFPHYTTTGQILWQLGTNHVVIDVYDSGHSAMGFGSTLISKTSNTCGGGGYDSRAWAYKIGSNTGAYASPHHVLMPGCVSTTSDPDLDSHESWFDNKNDANANAYPLIVWSITGNSRPNTGAYLEWEIVAMQTSAALAQWNLSNWGANVPSTIWRLAHSYNEAISAQCSEMAYATLGMTADGKYIAFESDWNGQTGTGTCTNSRRIDVFILDATTSVGRELKPSSAGGELAPPASVTATVQ